MIFLYFYKIVQKIFFNFLGGFLAVQHTQVFWIFVKIIVKNKKVNIQTKIIFYKMRNLRIFCVNCAFSNFFYNLNIY
jgi:hypothetical protein